MERACRSSRLSLAFRGARNRMAKFSHGRIKKEEAVTPDPQENDKKNREGRKAGEEETRDQTRTQDSPSRSAQASRKGDATTGRRSFAAADAPAGGARSRRQVRREPRAQSREFPVLDAALLPVAGRERVPFAHRHHPRQTALLLCRLL